MKKSLKKIIGLPLNKLKLHKERVKRFNMKRLSDYKEDFVITAQEEKEGGFFRTGFKIKNVF